MTNQPIIQKEFFKVFVGWFRFNSHAILGRILVCTETIPGWQFSFFGFCNEDCFLLFEGDRQRIELANSIFSGVVFFCKSVTIGEKQFSSVTIHHSWKFSTSRQSDPSFGNSHLQYLNLLQNNTQWSRDHNPEDLLYSVCCLKLSPERLK